MWPVNRVRQQFSQTYSATYFTGPDSDTIIHGYEEPVYKLALILLRETVRVRPVTITEVEIADFLKSGYYNAIERRRRYGMFPYI